MDDAEGLAEVLAKLERNLARIYSRYLAELKLDFKLKLLSALAFSMVDLLAWKGTEKANPWRAFRRRVGAAEKVGKVEEAIKELLLLKRGESAKLAASYFLAVLERCNSREFVAFSAELRESVLSVLPQLYGKELFKKKSYCFGKLYALKVKEKSGAMESLRLSLLVLPAVNQAVANQCTYLLVRVMKLWNDDLLGELHVPLDGNYVRTLLRMGYLERRPRFAKYDSKQYMNLQRLARSLVPRCPIACLGFRIVGRLWCKPLDPRCLECPLATFCSYSAE